MLANNKYVEKKVQEEVRYITKGIIERMNRINPVLYLTLWQLYDGMAGKKDDLHVFELNVKISSKGLVQEIIHYQEEPEYRKIYRFYTNSPVEEVIYIIKDDNNITMALASETKA